MPLQKHIIKSAAVDKNSPIPVYYQIKERIKDGIVNGSLKAHDKIPAERELCNLYEVSRMTARQAMSELVKEGYLYREKGRGTFVAPPKITHPMMSLVSFSEDMHQRGLHAGGKTIKREIGPCRRKAVLQALSLTDAAEVLMIERLRLADAKPMVLERSCFSAERLGGLMEEDLESDSLYRIMAHKYGILPKRSRESIEAGLADAYLSEYLEIEKGSPILLVTGISYGEDNMPIEFVQSYYRGDRYSFLVDLER